MKSSGIDKEAPDAVAPPPGHLRLPLVDGARAIAAFTILALHVGGAVKVESGGWWQQLVGGLGIGVPIFFVISGFLLYRPFVAADVLGAPSVGTAAFLWRRALRIIPLYWVALTVVFIITSHSTHRPGGFFSGEPWWVFYGFGQVYDPGAKGGGLTQAWTLCIEVTFYLSLPLYALALSRVRRFRQGFGFELGLLALLAIGSITFRMQVVGDSLVYTLPSYFYLFACGMFLALLSVRSEKSPRLLGWLGRHGRYSWAAAAVLFCLQAWVVRPGGFPLAVDLLDAVIATLVLAPAIFGDGRKSLVRSFLAHPSVAWIGLVSYGLYLWHPQVVSAIYNAGIGQRFSGLGYFALLALAFALTAALAGVTYYAIERPTLKLKRRTPFRRIPQSTPPTRRPDPAATRTPPEISEATSDTG